MTLENYIYTLKKYFSFTKQETKHIIASILIITLIISFNDQQPTFQIFYWITNFMLSLVIVAISFIIHESAHRAIGLKHGYKAEYQIPWYGILASVIIMLISRGNFWFFLPGGVFFDIIQKQRLGKFRYGINYSKLGRASLAGPIANLILAFICKIFLVFIQSDFLEKALIFNVLFAIYALLPISPSDGINVFFGSRITYFPSFAAILISGITLIFAGVLLSILSFIVIFLIVWWMWYYYIEYGKGEKPLSDPS